MSHPLPNFHFTVQIDDLEPKCVQVRNLAMHFENIETATSSNPTFADRKQPGRSVYENFFLERAVFANQNEFFEWWRETQRAVVSGGDFRKNITISLLDNQHSPIMQWRIGDAFPLRLSYSELDAKGNRVLTEVLEIACESIDVRTDL
ncbi:MAG: phage tail protein [Bacteroidota bacterium]